MKINNGVIKTFFLIISIFLLNAIDSSAAIVLTITADSPSSTQITITAAGENIVGAGGVNSLGPVSNGRLPVSVNWSGSTGNMKITDLDASFSASNFSLNGVSTLQYTHNGSVFGSVLDDLETYNPNNSPDEFRVGPSSAMLYPAMSEGDSYGFTGSVTFDLTGGMTAAAFTNGSLDNPINGGNFTWTVAVVPEPSSYAIIFGSVLLLFAGYRKRKALRAVRSNDALFH